MRILALILPFCLFAEPLTILVFGGKTGWIGKQLVELIEERGDRAVAGEARLENREQLEREIEAVRPDRIINAAGVTGRPNVDWCETHRIETIRSNLLGALNLFDAAFLKGIHVTNFGTGCIYEYDGEHPLGSGIGFNEADEPNFEGSFYSRTKGMLDRLTESYPNVLNLRLRMPISSDLHPRSFLTKILGYRYVIDVPNSVTVLDDLLPIAVAMAERKRTGNYNFTNPGTISHSELLSLYREIVDPEFSWNVIPVEELGKYVKAPRSNNELDVKKLTEEFPDILTAKDAVRKALVKIRASRF